MQQGAVQATADQAIGILAEARVQAAQPVCQVAAVASGVAGEGLELRELPKEPAQEVEDVAVPVLKTGRWQEARLDPAGLDWLRALYLLRVMLDFMPRSVCSSSSVSRRSRSPSTCCSWGKGRGEEEPPSPNTRCKGKEREVAVDADGRGWLSSHP